MKKILLFILLFSIGTSAQFNRFGFGKSEYFNVSVSIDPMGSIDTETPNFTTEIELVENAFYVKTGIQVKKEKDKTMKKLLTIIILLLSLSSFAQVEVIKINCQRAYTPCYV